MLGLLDSFSVKWLAFILEQTVPHYWLTCFSTPTRVSFWINSLREGRRGLAGEFNLSYRYIDDLISLNNERFGGVRFCVYPKKVTISETVESVLVAYYLDLLFV